MGHSFGNFLKVLEALTAILLFGSTTTLGDRISQNHVAREHI
jgi:hypothetical protein